MQLMICHSKPMMKRYQYWASDNGKPYKKFTDWFQYDGDETSKIQMKGYKGDVLLQEFRDDDSEGELPLK